MSFTGIPGQSEAKEQNKWDEDEDKKEINKRLVIQRTV